MGGPLGIYKISGFAVSFCLYGNENVSPITGLFGLSN